MPRSYPHRPMFGYMPMQGTGGGSDVIFSAPLKTSVLTSKGELTYTGVATTTTDFESVSKTGAVDEAVIQGGRRVKNLIPLAEKVVDSATNWAPDTNVTVVANSTDIEENGTFPYSKVTYAAAATNDQGIRLAITGATALDKVVASIVIRGTGNEQHLRLWPFQSRALLGSQIIKPSTIDQTCQVFETDNGAQTFMFSLLASDITEETVVYVKNPNYQVILGNVDDISVGEAIYGDAHWYDRKHAGKTVPIGDSFTASATGYAALMAWHDDKYTFPKGVSGNTLTQMDTRYAADVTANTPDVVVIQGGINSVTAGHSLATMQTDMNSMIGKANAATQAIVLVNISPYENSVDYLSAENDIRVLYNTWLDTLGYEVVDIDTLLGDPALPNELLAAYDSGDGKHPSALGYLVMQRAVTQAVKNVTPAGVVLPVTGIDIDGSVDGNTQIQVDTKYLPKGNHSGFFTFTAGAGAVADRQFFGNWVPAFATGFFIFVTSLDTLQVWKKDGVTDIVAQKTLFPVAENTTTSVAWRFDQTGSVETAGTLSIWFGDAGSLVKGTNSAVNVADLLDGDFSIGAVWDTDLFAHDFPTDGEFKDVIIWNSVKSDAFLEGYTP